MKNLTLRYRILASFMMVIVILILAVIFTGLRLSTIAADAGRVETGVLPALQHASMMRQALVDSFIITQDMFLDEPQGADLKALHERLNASLTRLEDDARRYEAIASRDGERRRLQEFRQSYAHYSELLNTVWSDYEAGRQPEARRIMDEQLHTAWQASRANIISLIENNSTEAGHSANEISQAVTHARVLLIAAVMAAIVMAMILGWLLLRNIMTPVQQLAAGLGRLRQGDLTARLSLGRRDEFAAIESGFNSTSEALKALVAQAQQSAVQVATSVTEIAASAQEQQSTATETAATTAEIGATSREIAATSRDLVRTMGEVSDAADQASILAGAGQLGLNRMEDTMQQVIGAAELVNAKLAVLNEKAGNINQMVVTIVKVADQTNLLSLNAAIEAEKAGEYGRGFAVVATEVRRLADQTAIATYDIEQMVREIQSAVSAGVMGMDRFSEDVRRGIAEVRQIGEQLGQIIHQVQALAPRVQMVNEGMHAQSTGAEQINQALAQLSEAAGQTVDSLRQTGLSIDELNLIANALRSGVSRFKV